jgi:protein-tyrosine phosphatase
MRAARVFTVWAFALAWAPWVGCTEQGGGTSEPDVAIVDPGAAPEDDGQDTVLRDTGTEPADPGADTGPVDPGAEPEDRGAEPADPGADTGPVDPGAEPVDHGSDAVADDPGAEPVDPGADAGPPPSRWITLAGVMNTRDLGGWPVEGGGHIRWRVLVRSGELSGIDDAGCATLREMGLATVIDLRDGSDLNRADAQCALDQVRYEVASMPKLLPPGADTYTQTLDQSGDSIRSIFSLLAEPDALPVLFHCVIGRDRVNVVTALIMLALGASRYTVLAEYALSNDIAMSVQDTWIEAVLDKVDDGGGIDAYLGSLGVTAGQLEALREAVVEQ